MAGLGNGFILRLRATVCSLIIHEFTILQKVIGCMGLSFMVLCKIVYNQVKFQVLWPRLKMGSSTVMFTIRIRIASPEGIFACMYCQHQDCFSHSLQYKFCLYTFSWPFFPASHSPLYLREHNPWGFGHSINSGILLPSWGC